MRFCLSVFLAALAFGPDSADATCGGSFPGFVNALKSEALAKGHSQASVNAFFDGVSQDPKVLRADRAQGVFQRPFVDFSRRLISKHRIARGREMAVAHDAVFDRIESTYGVSRGVLLAFWAFETDFGAVQGDFNTRNALVTLSHDCRRPDLFRPQVFAALTLFEQGGLDPARTTGAWAGEIGMVQMLPRDILDNGVDGDGDGKVDLKRSPEDALMSGARMLAHLGWRANQPWLQEVHIPDGLDLSLSGTGKKLSVTEWRNLGLRPRKGSFADDTIQASLLLPQGHRGPAFLAYPNFDVYFEWNQSFTYVLTAAYFATRLQGADIFDAGNPSPGLSASQMKQLQQKLQSRGHDVGDVDGILGARTRAAVQKEQQRLGLPADAWPTPELLSRL